MNQDNHISNNPLATVDHCQSGSDNFVIARVIAEHKGLYNVKTKETEYLAKITGKSMFQASSREDYPAVGDWVKLSVLDEKKAMIEAILPRKTILKRKFGDSNKSGEKEDVQIIAANIDVAFVIESVDRDYNLNRFERYFALAYDGGIKPAILLNKTDLISKEELDSRLAEIKARFKGIDVISTSTLRNEGLDELKRYLERGKTYCFLGSSGVGKSSLINALIGENTIKTNSVSSHSGRGKHTTTARQMYFLENGAMVIDNPGLREVGLADVSQGVAGFFDEITGLAQKCQFSDCTHTHEPGCEVVRALQSGILDEEKYFNYISLKKEAAYYESSYAQKREKDRQFGKFMKKAKKDLGKFRPKN